MHFLGLPRIDPSPHITRFISDKDILDVGNYKVTVLHTPGHTPGSVCFGIDGVVLVGDTVFAGGAVGRTDHSYSRPLDLSVSLEKIRSYPKGTRILPGHGVGFRL